MKETAEEIQARTLRELARQRGIVNQNAVVAVSENERANKLQAELRASVHALREAREEVERLKDELHMQQVSDAAYLQESEASLARVEQDRDIFKAELHYLQGMYRSAQAEIFRQRAALASLIEEMGAQASRLREAAGNEAMSADLLLQLTKRADDLEHYAQRLRALVERPGQEQNAECKLQNAESRMDEPT